MPKVIGLDGTSTFQALWGRASIWRVEWKSGRDFQVFRRSADIYRILTVTERPARGCAERKNVPSACADRENVLAGICDPSQEEGELHAAGEISTQLSRQEGLHVTPFRMAATVCSGDRCFPGFAGRDPSRPGTRDSLLPGHQVVATVDLICRGRKRQFPCGQEPGNGVTGLTWPLPSLAFLCHGQCGRERVLRSAHRVIRVIPMMRLL